MKKHNGIILNIRGCNASGKTTAVREYIKTFKDSQIININGHVFTRCSDTIFALGRYDKKNGGCDGYKGGNYVIEAISTIIEKERPKLIIYEGMLYSKTFKFAYSVDLLFKERGYRYKGVYLYRPFPDIIKLLEARNNGANYDISHILNTHKANETSYKKLKDAGIDITKVDAGKIPLEEMKNIIKQIDRTIGGVKNGQDKEKLPQSTMDE